MRNNMKKIISTAGKSFSLLLIAVLAITEAKAQLNPLSAIYFQNQYLANPAMAGVEEGLLIDLAYRQQWSSMPGAPVTQSITTTYNGGKRVGLGISAFNEEAGLLKRTRVMGTYAYHLPLNGEGSKLSFGISLGFMDQRIMNENIDGNPNDNSLGNYRRDTYIDGDFGAAFTSKGLNVQMALPNLKYVVKQDEQVNGAVDRATFFSSVSYKFTLSEGEDGVGLEPKVCFREVQNFKNLLDIGTNLTLANNKVNVLGMYHSSRSATIGMGVNCSPALHINGLYTSQASEIRSFINGNFEINLKLNVSKLRL